MTDRDILISPSLMCADQLKLGDEISGLEKLGVDMLHLDIMDGHYVPNMTFGTDQCRAFGSAASVPLDIHLMVDEPDAWVPIFASAGNEPYVTIHPDTTWHPARTLASIRSAGARPGLALDPAQSPAQWKNLFGLVDLVLIMTVNPGYSGQKMISWGLDLIRETRELRDAGGYGFRIEVDGNVSWDNIPGMIEAGADVLVVGTSSLFDDSSTRDDAMKRLLRLTTRKHRTA